MPAEPTSDELVKILRGTIVSLVKRDNFNLSSRQMGVFLICYLNGGSHTVRGLALDLNVTKACISRSLDRLMEFELVRREVDPCDRRSIFVRRTPNGAVFLRELRGVMIKASV